MYEQQITLTTDKRILSPHQAAAMALDMLIQSGDTAAARAPSCRTYLILNFI